MLTSMVSLDSEKVWTIDPHKVKMQDLVGMFFIILNLACLYFCAPRDPKSHDKLLQWFQTVGVPQWMALLAPVLSTALYIAVHVWDMKKHIGGVSSQSKTSESESQKNLEYADSAILRQSIHALLAAALIAGLIPDSKDRSGAAALMAKASIAALALSTAFSLVSVLCYGYSKRWTQDKTAVRSLGHSLLNRGFQLDKPSWYFLILGLVWLPGIWYPFASVLVNIVFGYCLFVYYFDRGDKPRIQVIAPERSPEKQGNPIANLAYQLWQQRGCPVGSPDDDWKRAEALLAAGRTQSALGSV